MRAAAQAAVWGRQAAAAPAAPLALRPCQPAQRCGQTARRHATPLPALPPDALGALPTAAAAAAAASLLTASWLRPGGTGERQEPDAEEEPQPQPQQPQQEPPSSAEAIWAAAWRGVTPDAAEAAAGAAAVGAAEARQPDAQQRASGSDAGEDGQEALRGSPVLYLEVGAATAGSCGVQSGRLPRTRAAQQHARPACSERAAQH